MTKRNTFLLSFSMLVVGLIAGFLLYIPIASATGLHAGGVVADDSQGIWTGTEYAKPWLWTSTQWASYSSCITGTDTSTQSGFGGWPTLGFTTPPKSSAECAAAAIANSQFGGGSPFSPTKLMTLNVSTISRLEVATVTSLSISTTGAISGNTIADNGTLAYPTGTAVSGYINPNGQFGLSIGKNTFVGYLAANGQVSKASTRMYSGVMIDNSSLQAIPGITLLPTTPYISDTTKAASITPAPSVYELNLWDN